MIQFYLPDIAESTCLPEDEARHCLRVLRKKVGDEIIAVDGKGYRYRLRIVCDDPRHGEVEIIDRELLKTHWQPAIELAVAPTKNSDRMEWMVEKVVEMGIDRITPLRCEHSERKNLNVERLRKIAVSAMKQSLKATLPRVDDMIELKSYISEPFGGEKYVCYCDEHTERTEIITQACGNRPIRILIGPEGDFSSEEISKAFSCGYKAVTLGNSRLRTETAAVVAVADAHVMRRLNNYNTDKA